MKTLIWGTLAACMSGSLPAGAVEIVAHRGASFDAPENTLAAYDLAWKQHADSGEMDVLPTKDGVLVLMHDDDTKRTTSARGLVKKQTLNEIRGLDAGRWKGQTYAGEKVPTLEEALAVLPDGKRFIIELKDGGNVLPELDRTLKASGLKAAQTAIMSFDADLMGRAREVLPHLELYLLFSYRRKNGKYPTAVDLATKAKSLGMNGVALSEKFPIDGNFAAVIRKAGLRLLVWTVNDADRARQLVDAGVDSLITDRPGWIREQLGSPEPVVSP